MAISDRWPAILARSCLQKPSLLSAPLNLDVHLQEALSWIVRAGGCDGEGGIPAFYDLLRGRWAPSYPETTGYIVQTLLACAQGQARSRMQAFAIALADYLLRVRTAEGGVGHWKRLGEAVNPPIIFDTGQVIFGWLAAWRVTGEGRFLQAAERAGDWLVSVQSRSGAWQRYQHQDTVKVIDARVAWALLQLAEATSGRAHVDAARRNLDWVLEQQESNGWFRHASFLPGKDPFTHTIAYTAEGLLESGILLNETRYLKAAEMVARALLSLQHPDGSLSSTYDASWQPTARSSCLTGNCQMALLWLRFHGLSRDPAYLDAARRAITFVASVQNLQTPNPDIRGAIAGSYPMYGHYARFQYPNWAAKFFIDALLALKEADGNG